MRVLFLMKARGGSKGVPGKNLREIAGLSLVGFKTIGARQSTYCDRVILSTDSPDIQENGRHYGAETPFTRPAELATDTATSADVVLHAMDWIETHTSDRYDAIMLLEPTTPFTRPSDYDNAIELMIERRANVVVGVRPVEVNSVFVGPLDEQGRITSIVDKMLAQPAERRQDVAQEYTMNGALYLFGWEFFRANRNIYCDRDSTYGYVMEREYSVEIDSFGDLHWAEFLVERGHVDMSYWRQR